MFLLMNVPLLHRWVGILAFGEGWHNNHHGKYLLYITLPDLHVLLFKVYVNIFYYSSQPSTIFSKSYATYILTSAIPCCIAAFEFSARHGLEWWQFDMTWILIRTMEVLGLATNVKLPTEKQLNRLRFPSPAAA